MRYLDVLELIKQTGQDHEYILENATDSAVLTTALQKLPSLSEFIFRLHWSGFYLSGKLGWMVDCIWYGQAALDIRYGPHHLAICLQALSSSQFSSRPVTNFKVVNCEYALNLRPNQINLLRKAFANIETLTLESSDYGFEYLVEKRVDMPALKKLVIMSEDYGIDIGELEEFCKRNGRHLELLHLDCAIYRDKEEADHRYPYLLSTLQKLHRIGEYCALREAILKSSYHDHDTKMEALLLGNIAYEDIESTFKR